MSAERMWRCLQNKLNIEYLQVGIENERNEWYKQLHDVEEWPGEEKMSWSVSIVHILESGKQQGAMLPSALVSCIQSQLVVD